MAGEAVASAPAGGATDAGGGAPPQSDAAPKPVVQAKPAPKPVPPVRREPVIEKKPAPGEVPAAKAAEAKKQEKIRLQMKIRGQEQIEEYDSVEDLQRARQRERAELEMFRGRQADIDKKNKLLGGIRPDNVFDIAKQLLADQHPDFDPEAAMIERLRERVRLEEMDPRDREIHEAKQKLAEYEQREQSRTQTEKQRAEAARAEQEQQAVEQTVLKALERLDLGDDVEHKAELIIASTDILDEARKLGEDLTADDVAAYLKQREMKRSAKAGERAIASLKTLDGDALLTKLGDEFVDRIVAAHMQRTTPADTPTTRAAAQTRVDPMTPDAPWTEDDSRALLGRKFRAPPRDMQ